MRKYTWQIRCWENIVFIIKYTEMKGRKKGRNKECKVCIYLVHSRSKYSKWLLEKLLTTAGENWAIKNRWCVFFNNLLLIEGSLAVRFSQVFHQRLSFSRSGAWKWVRQHLLSSWGRWRCLQRTKVSYRCLFLRTGTHIFALLAVLWDSFQNMRVWQQETYHKIICLIDPLYEERHFPVLVESIGSIFL